MAICKQCGSDVPSGVKFCPECGASVSGASIHGTIEMKCRQCNGILTTDKDAETLVCPYCGSKELIVSSDSVAVEKIKQQTEFKKWEREDQKEQQKKKEQEERSYKFGAFGVISIICAVLFGFFAATRFTNIKNGWTVFAGIIAVAGIIVFAASVITRRGIVKVDKSYMPTVLMIAGFLLFIPFFMVDSASNKPSQTVSTATQKEEFGAFTWPDSNLAKMLPAPKSNVGRIITDSSSRLFIRVVQTSQKDFEEYIAQCKERGFTENYERTSAHYTAYNQEDYYLDIFYNEDDSEMRIMLDEPQEATTAAPATEAATEKETKKPTEAAAEKPTEPPTQKPVETEEKRVAVSQSGAKPGETVQGDLLKFTFENAKEYDEIKVNSLLTNTPEAGKKYLVLFFKVENPTDKKRVVSRLSFTASEDGKECAQVLLMGDPEGYDDLNGTVKAGESMKGCLIYAVSENWKEFSLSYEKLWGDSKTYTFYVTPDLLS